MRQLQKFDRGLMSVSDVSDKSNFIV